MQKNARWYTFYLRSLIEVQKSSQNKTCLKHKWNTENGKALKLEAETQTHKKNQFCMDYETYFCSAHVITTKKNTVQNVFSEESVH